MSERTLKLGDRLEGRVHVGANQYEWYKGTVVGVRDTNFDLKFDEPAGPMKVGFALCHLHHEGEQWRYAPEEPSQPEASEPKAEADAKPEE